MAESNNVVMADNSSGGSTGEALSETSTRSRTPPNPRRSSSTPASRSGRSRRGVLDDFLNESTDSNNSTPRIRPTSQYYDPARQREREDRVRRARERQNDERQKKLEELLEQQRKAENFRLQQQEERRQKLQEMRLRDETHRQRVEERRIRMEQVEKERLELLIRKSEEREIKPFRESRRLQACRRYRVDGRCHPRPHSVGGLPSYASPTIASEARAGRCHLSQSVRLCQSVGSVRSKSADHRMHRSLVGKSIDRLSTPKTPVSRKPDLSRPASKAAPAVPRVVPREVVRPKSLATTKGPIKAVHKVTSPAQKSQNKTMSPSPQDDAKINLSANVAKKMPKSPSKREQSPALRRDPSPVGRRDPSPVGKCNQSPVLMRRDPSPGIKRDSRSLSSTRNRSPVDEKTVGLRPTSANRELSPHVKSHLHRDASPSYKLNSARGQQEASPVHADGSRSAPKEISEDEYRAKLAEHRRQARERADKEAEERRKEQESQRLKEQEQQRKEEQEQKRLEEEDNQLADEARKAEEERLKKAIEENEAVRREEKAREEAERKVKEEQRMAAKLALEKMEKEREEKARRDEEERIARKKRLEMIMKRVKPDDKAEPNTADMSMSMTSAALSDSISSTAVPSIMTKSLTSLTDESTSQSRKFKSPLLQQMLDKAARLKVSSERLNKSTEQLDVANGENRNEAQGETSEITLQAETTKETGMGKSKLKGGVRASRTMLSSNTNGDLENMNNVADSSVEQVIQLDNREGLTSSDLLNSNETSPIIAFESTSNIKSEEMVS